MATTKKAAKPKAITSRSLGVRLKALGYTVKIQDTNHNINAQLFNKNGYRVMYMECEAQRLPYCCGVNEIGNLRITKMSTLNRNVYDLFLQRVLLYMKGQAKEKRRPVIFCSNGNESCTTLENAIVNFPHYKLVSTTINPGSSNTIRVYITT